MTIKLIKKGRYFFLYYAICMCAPAQSTINLNNSLQSVSLFKPPFAEVEAKRAHFISKIVEVTSNSQLYGAVIQEHAPSFYDLLCAVKSLASRLELHYSQEPASRMSINNIIPLQEISPAKDFVNYLYEHYFKSRYHICQERWSKNKLKASYFAPQDEGLDCKIFNNMDIYLYLLFPEGCEFLILFYLDPPGLKKNSQEAFRAHYFPTILKEIKMLHNAQAQCEIISKVFRKITHFEHLQYILQENNYFKNSEDLHMPDFASLDLCVAAVFKEIAIISNTTEDTAVLDDIETKTPENNLATKKLSFDNLYNLLSFFSEKSITRKNEKLVSADCLLFCIQEIIKSYPDHLSLNTVENSFITLYEWMETQLLTKPDASFEVLNKSYAFALQTGKESLLSIFEEFTSHPNFSFNENKSFYLAFNCQSKESALFVAKQIYKLDSIQAVENSTGMAEVILTQQQQLSKEDREKILISLKDTSSKAFWNLNREMTNVINTALINQQDTEYKEGAQIDALRFEAKSALETHHTTSIEGREYDDTSHQTHQRDQNDSLNNSIYNSSYISPLPPTIGSSNSRVSTVAPSSSHLTADELRERRLARLTGRGG